ncbi:MAG: DNA polymerase III subunit gamma/tau [Bacteroidota bacterium]
MENFIVSARKYRPVTFDTVVGQAHITETLKNAIRNNHLAQSFLFCGPRGVGKTTCARILAKTINCFNPTPEMNPCNECPSCKSFNESSSFNIHELDAASNNSVDDIRSLIEKVRIPPQVGKYKIYIIDEVHMLSTAAFNAFLKTLEEPPSYAKFILATTEKHKIIPTILSRCQIFDFKRITIDDIAKHLAFVAKSEVVVAEPDALHVIAQKADGALRDALSIFDQIISFSGNTVTYKDVIDNLNVLDYDYYFKITDFLIKGDVFNVILLFNEILYKGFDGHHFLMGLGEHYRNLLVCKDVVTIPLLEVGENIREKYKEQSAQSSLTFLAKGLDIFNKIDVQYQANRNKRLLVEIALMQMAGINTDSSTSTQNAVVKTVDANIPRIPVDEKKNPIISEPIKKIDVPVKQNVDPKPETQFTTVKMPIDSMGSLFSAGTSNIQKTNQEEKKNEIIQSNDKRDTKFSAEELNVVWNEFAKSIQKDNPSFASTLTISNPELLDNFIININIVNKAQEIEFEEKRNDLVNFLREKLNNYQIMVQLVLNVSTVEAKPYSPKDKFIHLLNKNPLLNDMKNAFGLELEY